MTHGMGGVEAGSSGSTRGANPLKQPLWLEKTLAGLHPWAQPCLRAARTPPVSPDPPKAKEAEATLGEYLHKALFSFQRGGQDRSHMILRAVSAFSRLAGVTAPEHPQLKEVQLQGKKNPLAFVSVTAGTMPAPEGITGE